MVITGSCACTLMVHVFSPKNNVRTLVKKSGTDANVVALLQRSQQFSKNTWTGPTAVTSPPPVVQL
jgi:hypothetical protein